MESEEGDQPEAQDEESSETSQGIPSGYFERESQCFAFKLGSRILIASALGLAYGQWLSGGEKELEKCRQLRERSEALQNDIEGNSSKIRRDVDY